MSGTHPRAHFAHPGALPEDKIKQIKLIVN